MVRSGDLVCCRVVELQGEDALMDVDGESGILAACAQSPADVLAPGTAIWCVVLGPGEDGRLFVSRKSDLLAWLLARRHFPVLSYDRVIERKNVRHAGKIALIAIRTDDEQDPRSLLALDDNEAAWRAFEAELGERVEWVRFDEDPVLFVKNALPTLAVEQVEMTARPAQVHMSIGAGSLNEALQTDEDLETRLYLVARVIRADLLLWEPARYALHRAGKAAAPSLTIHSKPVPASALAALQQLAVEIEHAIRAAGVTISHLSVGVSRNVASLSGLAATDGDRDAAERIAREYPGVAHVQNGINVRCAQ